MVTAIDGKAIAGESLPMKGAKRRRNRLRRSDRQRGEATGDVTATGQRTYFGKTEALVRSAKTVSHLQQIVFTVVKYMVFLDAFLAAVLLIYSLITGIALAEMIPLC